MNLSSSWLVICMMVMRISTIGPLKLADTSGIDNIAINTRKAKVIFINRGNKSHKFGPLIKLNLCRGDSENSGGLVMHKTSTQKSLSNQVIAQRILLGTSSKPIRYRN